MSDNTLVLIDPMATSEDADERAARVRDALIEAGVILPEANKDCVLGGEGHPPGPRITEAAKYFPYDGWLDWSYLTCGVEFETGKWINGLGFPTFHWAKCPACDAIFDGYPDDLTAAAQVFMETDDPPVLTCAACATPSRVQAWLMKPHMGFCYFAMTFWNWPSFWLPDRQDNVAWIAKRSLGNPLIESFGHL